MVCVEWLNTNVTNRSPQGTGRRIFHINSDQLVRTSLTPDIISLSKDGNISRPKEKNRNTSRLIHSLGVGSQNIVFNPTIPHLPIILESDSPAALQEISSEPGVTKNSAYPCPQCKLPLHTVSQLKCVPSLILWNWLGQIPRRNQLTTQNSTVLISTVGTDAAFRASTVHLHFLSRLIWEDIYSLCIAISIDRRRECGDAAVLAVIFPTRSSGERTTFWDIWVGAGKK